MTQHTPLPAHPFRVVAIAGSLRSGSYNRLLLQAARRLAPANVTINVYDDLRSIPLFDQDLEDEALKGPPSVEALRAAVREADGLMIATPEYNQAVPGVLKNAIDWLSRSAPDAVLSGKPVAVTGATTGMWGTRLAQGMLRSMLMPTGALIMPAPAVYVKGAAALFDADGALVDARTSESLAAFAQGFADWIARVGRPQPVPA